LKKIRIAQEIWNKALRYQNERISQSRAAISKLLEQMAGLTSIELSKWNFTSFGKVDMRFGSR